MLIADTEYERIKDILDLLHNLRISAGLLKSFEDEERTLLDVNEHRSQETFEEDKERIGYARGLLPYGYSKGKKRPDNRLFIEAVLYIAKTGSGWRQLPVKYGKWNSVWRRFNRLSESGIMDKIFDELKSSSQETIAIDSTSIKVHQEGMRYKKSCSQVYKFLV